MSQPVAFVSHFAVKPGKGYGLARIFEESSRRLQEEKPRTLVFLAYFTETGTEVSFLHVFADAESMDIHVQGSDERSRQADAYLEAKGWEVYGKPSQEALETLRQAASAAGVGLRVEPEYLGGFLRLGSS